MNNKCLFINKKRENNTGGDVISKRNLYLCKSCFGENNLYHYSISDKSKIETLINMSNGYMEGLNAKICNEIINQITTNQISHVFIDSSLYGKLAKHIKKKCSKVIIIIFFHNIETIYFKELIRVSRKKRHYLTLKSAISNEKYAVKYSDFIITLNERDSILLEKNFRRKSDLTLPSSFKDRFDKSKLINNHNKIKKLLFVGSLFFSNEEGIRWFISEVMPLINNRYILYVVGKDFELLKNELESDCVKIIGTTESLETWYYEADAVISPIFSGGGMKTKIAEALMYGKYIFGTDEAFVGYDMDLSIIGGLCNTKDEFANSLLCFSKNDHDFNEYSRSVFLEKYETNALQYKFSTQLIK